MRWVSAIKDGFGNVGSRLMERTMTDGFHTDEKKEEIWYHCYAMQILEFKESVYVNAAAFDLGSIMRL